LRSLNLIQGIEMISAKKCRIYAAECRLVASSSDIAAQRSLEQLIMALNWTALADEIDRNTAQAASVTFSPLGSPMVPSSLARLAHPSHQADQTADSVARVVGNIARGK
jgi:hypothetical protein